MYSKRVDGKFLGPGGSSVPEGQALLTGIMDQCFEMAHDLRAREAEEDVGPTLKPIYDRLSEIKAQLERLCELRDSCSSGELMGAVLTHRWTLRETDLYK